MSERSEYETRVIPAMDLASVVASVGPRSSRWRRAVWEGVMGESRLWFPGTSAAVQDRDLDRFVWSRVPQAGSQWDQPVVRVRRSLIQALPDTRHPAASLADALEQAIQLPDETGPMGRDAAVIVISGVILGLANAVAGTPEPERRRLAGLLQRASRQSRRQEVAELADFTGRWVRSAGPPPAAPADLPSLLRIDDPEASYVEASIRDQVASMIGPGETAPTGRWRGPRFVRPLLAQTSEAHRDLLFRNLYSGGILSAGDVAADVSAYPATHASRGPSYHAGVPAPAGDRINIGVVRADQPRQPVTGSAVATGTRYLLWVSLGPRDGEAVPDDDELVDLSGVTDDDTLDVAVFPDPALAVPGAPYTGSFVMSRERPLRVRQGAEQPAVSETARQSRLYVALRTPAEPGSWSVRVLVYHQNTLLQARRLALPVGRPRAKLAVRTPYTLVRSLTNPSLQELSERRLSVYVNGTADAGHHMCFRGSDGCEAWEGSAPLDSQTTDGLVEPIRKALRSVSWKTERQWNPKSDIYQYPLDARTGRYAPSFTQLRNDLFFLAARGFTAWEYLTSQMGSPDEQEQLRDRMRVPGIIEMAPAHGSRLIPPLAGLYDLGLDDERELSLCPDITEVLQDGGDLTTTPCFQAGCRHASVTTVCPSGFWGLRHQITVPTSLDSAAEADLRITAGTPGLTRSLIGTMPETVLRGVSAHAADIAGRFQESQHVTSRGDWLEEAPGDQYDVLYFLCHGGHDKTGDSMIILGKPGSPGIRRKDLNAYQVRFTRHRPLVVLNACETAALEPDKVITLIEGFTYYGASAAIGTEITVFNSLAYEFGTTFLDSFVNGQCHLGESVRRARLNLLSKWNPLGLAYVAYGLADLRLAS